MALVKRDIGELLVDDGQISPEELKRARDEKEKSGEPMSVVLTRLGIAHESHIKNALELEYGVNYVSLNKTAPIPDLLAVAGQELCWQYEAVPIAQDSSRLTLAMVMPSNQAAIDVFKEKFPNLRINPVVCTEADMADFLTRAFGPALKKIEPAEEKGESRQVISPATDLAMVAETPGVAENLAEGDETKSEDDDLAIVLLGNHILANAVSRGCTTIHVEPTAKEVLVHYRKDGVLFAARRLPRTILPALVNRFKTMAQISLEERSQPEDGRLNVLVSGKQLSFRLSIVPAVQGEHLVIWLD